jgi:type I restriction enzyme S subunit
MPETVDRIDNRCTRNQTGWRRVSLRDVIDKVSPGVSVNGEGRKAGENESGVLKLSAISNGRFNPGENKAIQSNEVVRAKRPLRARTLLMSRSNTVDLVGTVAYVPRDYPRLFLPDLLWEISLKPKGGCDPRWLAYRLSAPSGRRDIRARASGTSGSMKKLSIASLLSLTITLPPLDEQQQIATAFDTWSESAEAIRALIRAYRQLKRGLMQQLLSGRRRFKEFVTSTDTYNTRFGPFPKDWEYVRMGEIAEEVNEHTDEPDSIAVLSCTKHHGLVDSLEYFGKRVFSDNTGGYKLVRRGQFVYATNHIEEGSIGLLSHRELGLVSPMYTVFETHGRVCAPFLFALFKTELYRHIFEANTNASVDRRGGLRWHQFSRIHISLPSLDEQRAIADVFFSCDRMISLLRRKAELLEMQRRSLLDNLFTGTASSARGCPRGEHGPT